MIKRALLIAALCYAPAAIACEDGYHGLNIRDTSAADAIREQTEALKRKADWESIERDQQLMQMRNIQSEIGMQNAIMMMNSR